MKKVLVTGAAGFIGFSICNKLLENGINVHGLDNLNEYYDPRLKKARLEILTKKGMPFSKIDLADADKVKKLFNSYKPTHCNKFSCPSRCKIFTRKSSCIY